ncbi:hypothetical protein EG68_11432 [Paragonimus skrjabini miyazakii]|uniref:DUF4806 domain-containing protein n=1 Tax=Paragonimus skrjabini miyazakii TaxID=59628 RepID=A0A8S9YBS6_9TREM|nr:hypothetical protein EG68_11432 [Paragonimus skrjabini miyazakii]
MQFYFQGKKSFHLEVPTHSSSSPSPTVQPASVSKAQAGTTPTFPKTSPVNLENIATISATNTSDNVVISAAVLDQMNELLAFLTTNILEIRRLLERSLDSAAFTSHLTRLRAPILSGLVSLMMQTVLQPVFAKQVNYTGINQKTAFRDSKTLAIMREVILAREGAEVGDGSLLPAAIRTWLKGVWGQRSCKTTN